MDSKELDSFIDDILKQKNYQSVSEEGYKAMKDEMKGILVEQINKAALMAMPDEKLDELNARLDDGSIQPDQISTFVAESGVDLAKITTETMIYFRSPYLANNNGER